MSGFVVIDVETSGFSPARDRVIEVAAVQTDPAGAILSEWTTLLDPQGPVGRSDIHGIRPADVRGAPIFGDIVGEFVGLLAGRALVAHNARFDVSFLAVEFARVGYPMPDVPRLCTLEASWSYLPELDRHRLVDCCWICGIELTNAHSALGDARATAHLLAHYLDPAVGVPPTREHSRLPELAARVTWPQVRPGTAAPKPRVSSVAAPVPAPDGTLWTLLDALPLATVVEEGAPVASVPYLELLFGALEDGILTWEEAADLAELARTYGLTRAQVEATHRAFLLALAHRIVEDDVITAEERVLITDACRALGLDDKLPGQILDEAWSARQAEVRSPSVALPDGWALGEPLRAGQSVVFTGCDQIERARLQGRAQAAGLHVASAVSGRTALLVTDGADSTTRKAVAARERGTRVVSPAVFAYMVSHVLPASAAPVPEPRGAADSPAPPVVTGSPAQVRAWAVAHGHAVGVRGRIPADVLAAYQAAAVSAGAS